MIEKQIKQKMLFWGVIGFFLIITGFVFIQKIEAKDPTSNQLAQRIYQGNFDLNSSGDMVTVGDYVYHWKKILVPELDINQMPDLSIYQVNHPDQLVGIDGYPFDGDYWIQKDNTDNTIILREAEVWMRYKAVDQNTNQSYYDFSGDYKIVVTYTEDNEGFSQSAMPLPK